MMRTYGNEKPNAAAYLERIGYNGSAEASIAALVQLQECHLHAVPYENLDIMRKAHLSLEIPELFDKIVVQRRGGYCFELNALFGWLLQELGYSVTHYFARFWRDEQKTPPKRRHHVLRVKAEGRQFLCDVGIGGPAPFRPIELVEQLVHEQRGEYYQLQRDSDYGWMLCERKQGEWSLIYSFTEEPQFPQDYITTSFWCEHAPDSEFSQADKVAIRTGEGRKSVAGKEFRIFTSDGVHVFTPQTKEEYAEALHTHFGLKVAYVPSYLN